MDASTPWRNLGVIGLRLVDLAVRYTITFVITWAAVDAWLPVEFSVMNDWLGLVLFMWTPSILISFVYGLVNTRTGAAFRGPPAGLLLAVRPRPPVERGPRGFARPPGAAGCCSPVRGDPYIKV